jgi:hypothetical protein
MIIAEELRVITAVRHSAFLHNGVAVSNGQITYFLYGR